MKHINLSKKGDLPK